MRTWIVTEHADDSDVKHWRWDREAGGTVSYTAPRAPYDRVRHNGCYYSLANAKKALSSVLPARSTEAPQPGLTVCVWEVDLAQQTVCLAYVRTSADVVVR